MVDMAEYMKERRRGRRNKLIELAGGACVRCGAVDDLEFDHRDRDTKLFVLSGCHLDKSWDKVLKEFEKCDLLCRPCHLNKTKDFKEIRGGKACTPDDVHGVESHFRTGRCKCDLCHQAAYEARVRRGELSGRRGVYSRRQSS